MLLSVVSSGCTQWYYDIGRSINETVVTESSGDISLGQALDLLGPPQRVSSTSNGYALAWEHWRVRENSLGISLGALGVELMSIDWGNARAKGEFLLLTFDNEHQLSGRAHGIFDTDKGGGSAVQPFLSPVELVDVDDLVSRMPQHRWGATMLQRLPKALNATYSPNSGTAGIEQRGTPTGIGQQSLELD